MIISRPSSPVRLRLVLASAARWIAPGSAPLMSGSERDRSALVEPDTPDAVPDLVVELGAGVAVATSDMAHLSQKGLDLCGRRHGGGTFAAGADNGAGGISEAEDRFQIPAGKQPVAEGATEAVPGAE